MQIRPFQSTDQPAAKALILAGLVEHWGWLDPAKNPDLEDIAASYADGLFLVAYERERLVATGALLPEGEKVGRIVRMSVDSGERRRGYGRGLLHALLQAAREMGYTQVVLETTATWVDASQFYQANGFQLLYEANGDLHFVFMLAD